MKKLLLPALILSVFLAGSCTKEVTRSGGPQAKGIVFEIQPEDWVAENDSAMLHADFEVPELTDAILDHGAVMVYLSFDDGQYEALPEVYDYDSYTAIHSKGWVTVQVRDVDGYKVRPFKNEIWAKIVLIDAQKLALHPNVDLTNYEQVKQTFHVH